MEDNNIDSEKKSNYFNIRIITVIVVVIVAVSVSFYFNTITGNSVSTGEMTEQKNNELSEDVNTSVKSKKTVNKTSYKKIEKENTITPDYFVCVPVEEMSLRKTPGLGDDVVRTLKTGEIIENLNDVKTVNDIDFYRVKVKDSGEEGYVSSKVIVKYFNDYDKVKLNIVDTTIQKYSYDMMVDDIYELVNKYREVLDYEIIGNSYYGRDIYAVVLGNKNAKRHVFVQAAIHGREYMTTQVVMSLIEYYACYYDVAKYKNRTYRELFENTAIHIIPMSNPDGVTISQYGLSAMNDHVMYEYFKNAYILDSNFMIYTKDASGEYDWTDHYRDMGFVRNLNDRIITFEEYQTIWKANGRGVDLNNNFNADWENISLKPYATYASFKGEYPESEPETQALVKYATKYDFSHYISYHSRGQLVYYDCKGNDNSMSQLEEDFAKKVSSVIGYDVVKTQNGYNVNLGGFGDWVQLKLKKPSVTIENGKQPCPLPIKEFYSIWLRHKEFWASLASM